MQIRWIAAASLLVLACMSSGVTGALRDRVDRTRSDALTRPGPRQVADYIDALRDAHRGKAYAKDPQKWRGRAEEAIGLADRAAAVAGKDAATLVAWKALLLADLGRSDDSWAAFLLSMELEPNVLAAQNVVLVYGMASRPDKVGETCELTAHHVTDRDELYGFIEHCIEHM